MNNTNPNCSNASTEIPEEYYYEQRVVGVGRDCHWYTQNSYPRLNESGRVHYLGACEYEGWRFKKNQRTAQQACCACGGGTRNALKRVLKIHLPLNMKHGIKAYELRPRNFIPRLHFTPPLITRGGKIYIPDENPSVWRVSSVRSCGEGGWVYPTERRGKI